jgi:hypothetical protein
VIVQNQPGAGSVAMANAVYNNGPFDGTTIGAPFNGLPTTPQLQPSGVRFDPVKLIWLGSSNRETQITYLWHTAPVEKFEDIRNTQIVVGSQAPGTTQYDFPMVANALFGFKFKVINGYESTPKIHLAMESGEIQGNAATNWTTVRSLNPHWIAEKKIKILAQWALRKHPDLPDAVGARPRQDRCRTAGAPAPARAARIRPALLPAAGRAGRARQRAAARLRRHMKDKEFLPTRRSSSSTSIRSPASRSPLGRAGGAHRAGDRARARRAQAK